MGFWDSVGANAQRIFDMALRTTDANLGVASRLVEGFGKKSLMLDGLGALSSKSAFALYNQMKRLIQSQAIPAFTSAARGERIFLDEIAKLIEAFTQYEQAFRGAHGGPASAHGEAEDWLGKMQAVRNYAARGLEGVRPHRRTKQARR